MRILAAVFACAIASGQTAGRGSVTSHITVIGFDGAQRRVVLSSPRRFEAPNWSRDGRFLVLNSEGRLWRLALAGGIPEPIPTGNVREINNDHGISPDGSRLAISAGRIFVLPLAGGTPRQVTDQAPSYFHAWSPDGRTLAYCARRSGNFDIYTVPADGGSEQRLTTSSAYDDGPDYSPDGRWIYFNSDRSGSWDIWRMPAGGAGTDDKKAERVTGDELEDWFPHPSPDGRWLVFLSFPRGTQGHPANRDVVLRRMKLPGTKLEPPKIEEIVRLFGGQGTLNVPSWSPDSKRFAYVSYSLAE